MKASKSVFIGVMLLFILTQPAFASATAGLQWEGPLTMFVNSVKGPVAFAISLLGIVVCGAMLVFGGEINEFVRRFIMLVLVVSVIIFAAGILSTMFGASSAVIATTTIQSIGAYA